MYHGSNFTYTNDMGEEVALVTPRGLEYGYDYWGNFGLALYTMFQVLTTESLCHFQPCNIQEVRARNTALRKPSRTTSNGNGCRKVLVRSCRTTFAKQQRRPSTAGSCHVLRVLQLGGLGHRMMIVALWPSDPQSWKDMACSFQPQYA